MKLIASMIARNELSRYLEPCVAHLLEFCEEIRVLDDCSDDGTAQWLTRQPRVMTLHESTHAFYAHEGQARQRLLDWTLEGEPSHILSIDADEFIADGEVVRSHCAAGEQGIAATWVAPLRVWTLQMEEIWELDDECLCVREDGGWRAHPVPILYAVPAQRAASDWQIRNMPLACGREPHIVRKNAMQARPVGTEILHFGWANESERAARHERYVKADGGRYHAGSHLDSIMWRDERVKLRPRHWPPALQAYRAAVSRRIG